MRIAALAWGSLIWDFRDLEVRGEWREDGPLLPIEFARISRDGRLTLVIKEDSTPIRVLWNIMDFNSLEEARENLRVREGADRLKAIGYLDLIHVNHLSRIDDIVPVIKEWATRKNMDAVIWTDLEVNFQDKIGKTLNIEHIINYLKNLSPYALVKAKKYILNTHYKII